MTYLITTAAALAATYAIIAGIKWASNRALVGLLFSALLTVAILWLFYANFGEMNLYPFLVSFFFDFLFIPLGVLKYLEDRKTRYAGDATRLLRNDWLAVVVVVGFCMDYVGPVVGWGIAPLTGEPNWSWRMVYATRVLLAVVLPVVSGLVLLALMLRRKALFVYAPVVVLLTALPVWSGLDSALDLRDGPRVQIIRHGCYSDASASFKDESCSCNGRSIASCSGAQKDQESLVLRHTRRVLETAESKVLEVPGRRVELQIGKP
jgi:hypothetical protein